MNGQDVCPVCRNKVLVTSPGRFVWAHKDKAYNRCPMSGHPFPLSVLRAA